MNVRRSGFRLWPTAAMVLSLAGCSSSADLGAGGAASDPPGETVEALVLDAGPAVCALAEGTACQPEGKAPHCCASWRVCGNNGVKNDVCCEDEVGQECFSPDGCCEGLVCLGGSCLRRVCSLEEGAECTSAGEAPHCCASGRVCGSNGVKNGVCCESTPGADCHSPDGCCAGMACVAGVCKAPVSVP
jgi:hypothetical protein